MKILYITRNMLMPEFAVFFVKVKRWGFNQHLALIFSLIRAEKEMELLKKIGEFPQAVAEAATKRMPHRITNYIFDLASTFHSFYNAEKVIRYAIM